MFWATQLSALRIMMSLLQSKGNLTSPRWANSLHYHCRQLVSLTMSTENLIRITVLANRNPNISEAEFHKHWTEKHAPLVSSWLQRHGIVKYTQVNNSFQGSRITFGC